MAAFPRRGPRLEPRAFDALVAAGLLGLLVLSFQGKVLPGQRPADLVAWAIALGLTAPYAFHRQHPTAATVVALAALLAWAALHVAPYPAIGLFVLVFGIALHGSRRGAVAAFGATLAALVVSLALQPSGVVQLDDWLTSLLAACVALLGGTTLRQRRQRWASLEERAHLLERERAERERAAVAAERLRIARELHDVVAHAMSVIAVQAGVGSHVIDRDVDSARSALRVIEQTSHEALVEMRRMLGVLRDDTEPVEVRPAPGIEDLPALVREMRRSGLGVTLHSSKNLAVPPGVDLTAYRVVQESLTNVLKHGGPVAHVRVDVDEAQVTIEVTDDGRPTSAAARDLHPDPRTAPEVTASGQGRGHGLLGMRERLALYGGTMEAGPRAGGGFRVSACVPTRAT
ncbi:MAG TPA: histidine kinase [Terrabacter sp.]|nr:histidine kinase [Terrabacter sp.]